MNGRKASNASAAAVEADGADVVDCVQKLGTLNGLTRGA
jgi:hypothetical protein